MTAVFPAFWPNGAADLKRLGRIVMEISLHIGAHRSGTTTFQHYLRDQSDTLAAHAIGFWGPQRTRNGLLSGIFPGPAAAKGRNLRRRAEGRVQMHLNLCRVRDLGHLLVSDENMIGSTRNCLRKRMLYPAIGERMARISSAFGGHITRIALSVRAQDLWWASTCAYAVGRGHGVPTTLALEQIAHAPRSWRDVITDLACAVPEADIQVLPFERYAGRPDVLLTAITGAPALADGKSRWLNRAPDLASLRASLRARGESTAVLPDACGRWQPFSAVQSATMRETYADDLFWLASGADGLATLTEDPTRQGADTSPPAGDITRGHPHDIGQGHMAHSG